MRWAILVGAIVDRCVQPPSPVGEPCTPYFKRNGGDELSENIQEAAPKVEEAPKAEAAAPVEAKETKAPKAKAAPKTEAAAAIAQAQRRRELAEQVIRADVASAFARYVAAQSAVDIFEQGVLARSTQNVKSIRGAYELGAFRMTELLAEQRRLMDSEREYTEALTERYKALADLNSAMGVSGNDRNEMKRE